MPIVTMLPGMPTSLRRARLAGLGVFAVAALICAAIAVWPHSDRGQVHLTIRTAQVADGLRAGATVVADGVSIGQVTTIVRDGKTIDIGLSLDVDQVAGLTDQLTVSFSPTNMWGITGIALTKSALGQRIQSGTLIDLSRSSDEVPDNSLTVLLDKVSPLLGIVSSASSSLALDRLTRQLTAFTPLLTAALQVGIDVGSAHTHLRTVLRSQTALIGPAMEWGSALLGVLDDMRTNERLATAAARARFDRAMNYLQHELVPSVPPVFSTLHNRFDGYFPQLTPLLTALGDTIDDPDRTGDDLGRLLDRLSRTFDKRGDRTVLDIRVRLASVPAALSTVENYGRGGGQ
ncbi:Mce family protein [Gordonia effusa NBRC 100432]|uniref:Mce family protein n=1 Tax=Gordonia effusa NBRC 100432 TaxID=1077974 RepID=H0R407_9ACTN|nr:MlaD family protein [Gordonia effusa]GAB19808.1 Mce family protein [Gordonia effusa NBRC 100432]